jgi:hypothetical protein
MDRYVQRVRHVDRGALGSLVKFGVTLCAITVPPLALGGVVLERSLGRPRAEFWLTLTSPLLLLYLVFCWRFTVSMISRSPQRRRVSSPSTLLDTKEKSVEQHDHE